MQKRICTLGAVRYRERRLEFPMNPTVPIAVHGATGRMGQAVLRLALMEPRTPVVSALAKSGSPMIGKPLREDFGFSARELRYAASIESSASPAVLIDFSSAQAFDSALAAAVARRIPFVSGTTGLTPAQFAALNQAAAKIAVLWSANFSIGIAVLARLARDAAKALDGWDCEIAEAHHHNKKDAPSGTALMLGRVVAEARGDDFDRVAVRDRTASKAARDPSAIGFAVVRAGDIVGEHTVVFAGEGERIELTHRAIDRDIFARGALRAALWIAGRSAGTYSVADLLDSEKL
ncbi:MAG TPA: 4-hydroxy-tetrahydrodipicolinate reductase [Rhodanobacteraceae bacterium]|nr:4-hydroxy-tetrahydrodipicolinate reductase [Rhodanobacteraceae bacterium]